MTSHSLVNSERLFESVLQSGSCPVDQQEPSWRALFLTTSKKLERQRSQGPANVELTSLFTIISKVNQAKWTTYSLFSQYSLTPFVVVS